MLIIAGAQALLMSAANDRALFKRCALRRGFDAVLSTLASIDAPQAPQLVRGACDLESAPGSHCYYGLHGGSSMNAGPVGMHDLSKAMH